MAAAVAGLLAISIALTGNGAPVNLGVIADKSTYSSGEPVRLTVSVANRGAQPVTLTFRTAQRFDVRVRDAAGREVWRWSAERVFAQAIGEERLEPGGQRRWDVVVREALPPGSYTAVASLESVDVKLSTSFGIMVR